MKKALLIFSLFAFPLLTFSQQTIDGTIMHDNLERSYILYVPANYTGDEPVPLIFNFHGYTSNAEQQMGYGDFRPIADTAGFIVVHPQGSLLNGTTHWNVGGWTVGSTADDVGFTETLLDHLADEYNIDLHPNSPVVYNNLGYYYMSRGNNVKALEIYKRSAALNADEWVLQTIEKLEKEKAAYDKN